MKLKKINDLNYLTKRGKRVNIGILRSSKNNAGLYVAILHSEKHDTLQYLRSRTFDNLNLYMNKYFPVHCRVKHVKNITGIGEVIYYHYKISDRGKMRLKELRTKRNK